MTSETAIIFVLALTFGSALVAASYKNDHVLGRQLLVVFSEKIIALGMAILIVIVILFSAGKEIVRLLNL